MQILEASGLKSPPEKDKVTTTIFCAAEKSPLGPISELLKNCAAKFFIL